MHARCSPVPPFITILYIVVRAHSLTSLVQSAPEIADPSLVATAAHAYLQSTAQSAPIPHKSSPRPAEREKEKASHTNRTNKKKFVNSVYETPQDISGSVGAPDSRGTKSHGKPPNLFLLSPISIVMSK